MLSFPLRSVSMADTQIENQRRGFWLRMARERAGISQATAARELGLSGQSKSTLSAWEAGTREPRPSMVSRMAILYGIPVERLMSPAPTAYEMIDGWAGVKLPVVVGAGVAVPASAAELLRVATESAVEEGTRRAKGSRAPRTRVEGAQPPEQPARDSEAEPASPRGR